MNEGLMILVAGALLALGVGATLVAARVRVPGLVLFLLLGMALGSDVLGWLDFDDVELSRTIGIVALALILFEGGLAAGWQQIRPVLVPSGLLASAGTLATAAIVGLAATWLLDLSTLEGLLLGAIVAPTDAAAVFSVLRGSGLNRRLERILEAESGFNDPIAVVLVLGFIEYIEEPGFGVPDMLLLVAGQLALGAAVGWAIGRASVWAFERVRFGTTGLYPVASITSAALAFGAADVIGGSGFLAVYVTALILGSAQIPARRTIADFHDGLAWVSQIAMFFTLGLLVFPSEFGGIAGEAVLIAAVLMLVARPLAAIVCAIPIGLPIRETTLLGWAGLRGAVPIVLATFPVIDEVPNADSFFNIVFFVVLASTLIQGFTLEPLARALGLITEEAAPPRSLIEVGTIRRLGAEVIEYPVADGEAIEGRVVRELDLPRDALVSVIVRGEQALLPRGSTELRAGDRLHILVRRPARERVEALFERWRSGPIAEPQELGAPAVYGRAAIFSVRPWDAEDGDPGAPEEIGGVSVLRSLRTRHGEVGALVQLEDGRFAITGDGLVATGGARQLFRYCRDRIRRADDEQTRAWWQEVAGVLSQRVVR